MATSLCCPLPTKKQNFENTYTGKKNFALALLINQQIISNKPQRKSSRRSVLEGERLGRRRIARGEEREALALEGGEGSESTGGSACMYYLFSCLCDVHCLLSVVMSIICESQFF